MKWPRYIELLMGLWLMLAPWLLDYGSAMLLAWTTIACGVLIVLLDLASILYVRRYFYLAILLVAGLLWAQAYFAAPRELQGAQNNMTVSLLLLMFAILPTEATIKPIAWRKYLYEQAKDVQ